MHLVTLALLPRDLTAVHRILDAFIITPLLPKTVACLSGRPPSPRRVCFHLGRRRGTGMRDQGGGLDDIVIVLSRLSGK